MNHAYIVNQKKINKQKKEREQNFLYICILFFLSVFIMKNTQNKTRKYSVVFGKAPTAVFQTECFTIIRDNYHHSEGVHLRQRLQAQPLASREGEACLHLWTLQSAAPCSLPPPLRKSSEWWSVSQVCVWYKQTFELCNRGSTHVMMILN